MNFDYYEKVSFRIPSYGNIEYFIFNEKNSLVLSYKYYDINKYKK